MQQAIFVFNRIIFNVIIIDLPVRNEKMRKIAYDALFSKTREIIHAADNRRTILNEEKHYKQCEIAPRLFLQATMI